MTMPHRDQSARAKRRALRKAQYRDIGKLRARLHERDARKRREFEATKRRVLRMSLARAQQLAPEVFKQPDEDLNDPAMD